jgi:glycosyltransferase involved in cell wall biosynthesis
VQKLSVVIITYNEERNIGRCLQSVQDITDDIVVVDSFSTDRTEDICKEYPQLRFIQREWQGYAKTKNFANQHARHDYILSLDADEVVSVDLKKSIQEIGQFVGVYEFSRLSNYCGTWIKHCGWYPDKKIRLFPKNIVQWEGDFVHETLKVPANLSTKHVQGDILHYTYYTIEEHVSQSNKFSTIAANELIAKGKPVFFMQLFIKPIAKFIRNYFLKLGFLDGFYGFIICQGAAHETFLKYAKAWHLKRSGRK